MKPLRQQCSEETHTDGYLDFVSHHPLSHKAAVSRTLLSQAEKINDVPEQNKGKRACCGCLEDEWYPRELYSYRVCHQGWEPSAWPRKPIIL